MKKLIIILLMMAGSAHAASVLTGDPYCDEPLTRAMKAERQFLTTKDNSELATAWAVIGVYRTIYSINTCSVEIWNDAISSLPLTKEMIKGYRGVIRPQTFIN